MALRLAVRLILLGALAFMRHGAPTANFMALECVGSLMRMTLKAAHVRHKYLNFYAVDQFGSGRKIDEALAAQCGYTIFSDHRGNVEFQASLLSCYTHIQNDVNFTVTVQLDVATDAARTDVVSYEKSVSCPYTSWCSREILCETNHMEATSGVPSIWQIAFHTPTLRHLMLVSDAHKAGYGINTADTRILLRAGFTAPEVQELKIQGITFSAVRSSTFYKQRWMILMVDTAVACPVADMAYSEDTITWTIPKNISPLLVGASHFKDLSIEMRVNLQKLSTANIVSRNYGLRNDSDAIVIKTHVRSGCYGITYSINLFLEHQWEDDNWGVTKDTMIKAVTTPLYFQEPIIINNTNTSLRLLGIMVGSFLPDVELVNFTVKDKVFPVPVPEASDYSINKTMLANGSNTYNIEVGFDVPSIEVEYTGEDIRMYTLNTTLNFRVDSSIFTIPIVIFSSVRDADKGNVDQDWIPFLSSLRLAPESAKKHGYWYKDNGTHLALQVPRFSAHVTYEDISPLRISASLQLHLKNNQTLADMEDFSITCPFSSEELTGLPDCKSNGSVIVTAMKLEGVPGLDPSKFTLRDKLCQPAVVTKTSAIFVFNVNTCRTSRKKPEKNPAPSVEPGLGHLALSMKVSKDSLYSMFYKDMEHPVVKYLREPVFFEIKLLYSEDPQLELFLEDCWSTVGPDPKSSPQWDIIINSCANADDSHETVFHPVDVTSMKFPSHVKRFEVKIFTLMKEESALLEDLHFHCSMVICNSKEPMSDRLCTRKCVPGKQRLGSSARFYHMREHISSGAIILATSNKI